MRAYILVRPRVQENKIARVNSHCAIFIYFFHATGTVRLAARAKYLTRTVYISLLNSVFQVGQCSSVDYWCVRNSEIARPVGTYVIISAGLLFNA